MAVSIEHWAEQIRSGDVRAISRAITAIENHAAEAENLLRAVFPHTGTAYRIGITGAPGTGKSSLVDRLAAHYRSLHQTVGIIAIDPSSPYSGGAILGDRIRMQGHAQDEGIFIRSMATRGFLGGLARATTDVALLLDAAGKQSILVETVGVGQDEVDIVQLADCTLVVQVPGLGDEVQHIKAGLMEIGDIFVLNKADREGAERMEQQLTAMLSLAPPRQGWHAPVVRTVATENKGIAQLVEKIAEFRRHVDSFGGSGKRLDRWKKRLVELLQARLLDRVVGTDSGRSNLEELSERVAERKMDPYSAVSELLRKANIQ